MDGLLGGGRGRGTRLALSGGSLVPAGPDRRPSSLSSHTLARAGRTALNLQGEWAWARRSRTRQAGSLLSGVLRRHFCKTPRKPFWRRGRGTKIIGSAQATRGRVRGPWKADLCFPDPQPPLSPWLSPFLAALLASRGSEEFLCFTQRLEDLVCFWEEAASSGMDFNYSFSYQLE